MTEERFKYLMSTLPWNLSREDQAEATQLKEKLQPAIDVIMGEIFDKYEHCDSVFDDFNNEIESRREEALSYLKKAVQAGEEIKSILSGDLDERT